MDGWTLRASENKPLTSLLLSPNHLEVREERGRLMNVAPLSLASALASIVFPQPGWPYRSTPRGAERSEPPAAKSSGYVNG
jgi:hypothetical protein